jgi:hypothetical protein
MNSVQQNQQIFISATKQQNQHRLQFKEEVADTIKTSKCKLADIDHKSIIKSGWPSMPPHTFGALWHWQLKCFLSLSRL